MIEQFSQKIYSKSPCQDRYYWHENFNIVENVSTIYIIINLFENFCIVEFTVNEENDFV